MGFLFICTDRTQAECFERKLFGDTERNRAEVLKIKKGDFPGFLYNISSGKLFGVFEAISDGSYNIVSEAWSGEFPWQVRVEWRRQHRPLDRTMLENAGLSNLTYKRLLIEDEDRRLLKIFEAQTPLVADEIDQWLGKRFLELNTGELDWREFETRIHDAFRILGFDARLFGHEVIGPFPDIVLYPPLEVRRYGFDFWIVLDCKNISEYVLTEDDYRAMVSYIEEHRKNVISEGIDPRKCYFTFVALGFKDVERTLKKVKEIQSKTNTSGGILKVQNLLLLMLKKVKAGSLNISRFPDLMRGEEISKEKIDAVFPG